MNENRSFAFAIFVSMNDSLRNSLHTLEQQLEGEIQTDALTITAYATDASAYREKPLAVCFPKHNQDLQHIISFANTHEIGLIPRTAGTSLAGQVVGSGIVVDVSRYFTRILEANAVEQYAWVEPGVVRDELNLHLKPFGYFFGPETSTANRAMIGGMVGNNSSGSNSIKYGVTRDQVIEIETLLSDGSKASFKELSLDEAKEKGERSNLEGELYKSILNYRTEAKKTAIAETFPHPAIHRRNTGYALDALFEKPEHLNLAKLLAGSEGTLAFTTKIKLRIHPIPPENETIVAIHCDSIRESLEANIVAMRHAPYASELIDHYILECTRNTPAQAANRFFVKGDPQAILLVSLRSNTSKELKNESENLVNELKKEGLGSHFSYIHNADCVKVWNLRKAGLGLLSNIKGDAKPVPVIEDTAVNIEDLPNYIDDFNKILKEKGLSAVHYAHAGSGELHLRPILNLKTEEGKTLFKSIAWDIAKLVKQYRGSLSGEHGDGRLRAEFIPYMIGDALYADLQWMKQLWDPKGIFNPNKIVNAPAMNEQLRYTPNQANNEPPNTFFDWSESGGFVRAAELCNGSADCRKSEKIGGVMCPTYMATKDETQTTRARSNALREVYTNEYSSAASHPDLKEVLDTCISCKGCKAECPSNVDMAKLKAEWLHQHHQKEGIPYRTKLISQFSRGYQLASSVSGIFNFFAQNPIISKPLKKAFGFHPERSLPLAHSKTWLDWFNQNRKYLKKGDKGKVAFFIDEFTNYNEPEIGIAAMKVIHKLGFSIHVQGNTESGRTVLSKGLLGSAKKIAHQNVTALHSLDMPLIGIEPSALLTLRDEYPQLVDKELNARANKLSKQAFLFEEFLEQHLPDKVFEVKEEFSQSDIHIHTHCHQKALSNQAAVKKVLKAFTGLNARIIPSGCCGMAGSFGFEKEHFELSNQIGELVLYPYIRKHVKANDLVVATGTSCRHQVKDALAVKSYHTAEVLLKIIN